MALKSTRGRLLVPAGGWEARSLCGRGWKPGSAAPAASRGANARGVAGLTLGTVSQLAGKVPTDQELAPARPRWD